MVSRAAEQDEWRRKYYDSLRAADQEERQYRAQLQSLYKLVGRLCVAAQGQSPRLDDELKRLKDAVRRELPGDQLEPLSQAIADAVLAMEQELSSTQKSARREAGASGPAVPVVRPADAASTATVAVPLAPMAVAAPAGMQAAAGIGSTATVAALPGEAILGNERIRTVITRLLSELRSEPALLERVQALEQELMVSMTAEQLPQVIEKLGGMVVQRIGGLERARQELEILVGQMMGQLDSLTRYISGQTEEETDRTASSDALNLQITGEVKAIGESVENGTDLTAIRRQLRERLNSISRHLHSFRMREEERARLSRERTDRMLKRMEEMESEARKLQAKLSDEKRLSLLDPLTQIPNRLAYEQRVADEMERWRRFRQPTCVAAWDIDHFKAINDSYGHRAGDRVLAVVAESLARSIRSTDFVARYGGEEFVMLLPGTTLEDGRRLAEQMRATVAQIGFHFRGSPVSVTVSCGITALRDGDSEDDAFERADKAMYQAKDAGRDRVVSV